MEEKAAAKLAAAEAKKSKGSAKKQKLNNDSDKSASPWLSRSDQLKKCARFAPALRLSCCCVESVVLFDRCNRMCTSDYMHSCMALADTYRFLQMHTQAARGA